MSVGQDSDFSQQIFLARYNSDLANDFGNLVNRVLNLTHRLGGGVVPSEEKIEDPERELRELWEKTRVDTLRLFEEFQFHIGLERTFAFIKAINRYLEQRAPWKLGKSTESNDQALVRTVLATMAEALRLAVTLLAPVTPGLTDKVSGLLNHTRGGLWTEELQWSSVLTGKTVQATAILFPRPESAKKQA